MIVKSDRNYFILLLILGIFVFTFLSKHSVAGEYVSTADVVKEIEKTLIFDKGERQELNVYKQQEVKKKKSDLTINHGSDAKDNGYTKSEIDIVIVDPKVINTDIREKEKLAYNSALVGQYEVAIELYKQVMKAEPDNLYAKFSLAVVYQKLGQNRQAKTIYYELLKGDATNKEEIIGNLLAIMVDESPKDALYLLSRLTTENPQSSYILAQAALSYDKAKNYDQAIILLKRAIANDPTRLDYKYNLAVIYDKTANYDEALPLYSEVVRKSGGSEPSIPLDQINKRIEFIRNK